MTDPSSKINHKRMLLALIGILFLLGVALLLKGHHYFNPTVGGARLFSQAEVLKLTSTERPNYTQARWQAVTLPHRWEDDWPTNDGALWYRIKWQQTDTQPVSLLITSMSLAGSVYVNGQLLHQDTNLTEPLSRSWNTPYRTIIPPQLIHSGDNSIELRPQGYIKYASNMDKVWDSGGLNPVWIGPPDAIEALYQSEHFFKHELAIFNLATNVTLGLIFGALYLLHRKEAHYGWFALTCLAWTPLVINQIVTSPWPFNDSAGWHIMLLICSTLYVLFYTIFLMQMTQIRLPWPSHYTLLLCILLSLFIGLLPGKILFGVMLLVFALAMQIFFLYRALKFRALEFYIMITIVLLVVLTLSINILISLKIVSYRPTLVPLAGSLFAVGMAMILALRFVRNLNQIEHFQTQMQLEISQAEQALREQLHHKHQLDLNHSRIGVRLNLIRDLYDGFGRMLSEYTEFLHNPNHILSSEDWANLLKALRDDLRLIIETAGQNQDLLTQLPAVRRRLTEEMEQANIQGKWSIKQSTQSQLPLFIHLNMLRFLQDALAYTIRYAQATQISIMLDIQSNRLLIDIKHNGRQDFTLANHLAWQNIVRRTPNTQGVLDVQQNPPGLSLCIDLSHTHPERMLYESSMH